MAGKSDLVLNHACDKLRESKKPAPATNSSRTHDFSERSNINHTKEMASACPFYYGEERLMLEPADCRKKAFNPIIDMMSDKIQPQGTSTSGFQHKNMID